MFSNLSKTFRGVMSITPMYSAFSIVNLTFVYKRLQFTALQEKGKKE